MKGKYSLMVLAMMVCLVSCNKFYPGSRAAIGKKIIDRRMSCSAEMSYNEVYRSTMVNENRFIFGFSLDLSDYEHETIRFMEYRYIPSDDIFKSFGKNRKAVKNKLKPYLTDAIMIFPVKIGNFRLSLFYTTEVFH